MKQWAISSQATRRRAEGSTISENSLGNSTGNYLGDTIVPIMKAKTMNHHECGTTQVCKICEEEKLLSAFHKRKENGKYRNECTKCMGLRNRANRDSKRGYCRVTYDVTPYAGAYICTTCLTSSPAADYYVRKDGRRHSECKRCLMSRNTRNIAKNPDAHAAYHATYRKDNLAKKIQANIKRRTLEKQARPAWFCYDKVKAIYDESRRITEETGIQHHVDHIVPIKGKIVCGLNWHGNLQIITAVENQRKHNKLVDDMT